MNGLSIRNRMRLARFRRAHPDIDIGCEFGAWNAVVLHEGGERSLARHTLPALLDDLDVILAGGNPRADSG